MNRSELFRVRNLAVADIGPLDLALQPGECVGLTGASGSGKSRLLRALADLDPHRGGMWLDGEAAGSLKPWDWRRRVALLPAESAWWHDTVGPHFPDEPDAAALSALGFKPEVLGWRIDRLSSGEKQRLALLRVLALRPRVLLLDEPTANLDRDNAGRAEALIRDYLDGSGAAAIWVGHDQAQLRKVAVRCYRVAAGGTIREEQAA
ncbi:ABC transporter ATP-binding protein [Thiohalobacter thiocyanaticus]|uniref:ATP-binding cassette domain-containing protein n=1 Tax=Thiohalobacter thiocyanaticus TaxID=585455 RepID=A0A426QJW6_9GAMM|nr:ATP-binding cassette domain-containing protein [Thiohalobacter thiocyanaticus]RRQ22053.1 ATP-binding cassette domain-containing protein [Thiohalobacter thiocyanaticus]